jgi:excisionase family DNA binding protein
MTESTSTNYSSLAGVPDDALMTVNEVAAYLRVQRTFVECLLRRGVLSHERLGRRYRISAGDVRAYIASERRPRPAAITEMHSYLRHRERNRKRS